jgi:7-cyano-7-deazaguanine synthase
MKRVVLLSGGLDSAVLLAWVRSTVGGDIDAVTIDYGQRHQRELWSAFQIAHYYGAADRRYTLPPELLAGSSLTGGAGETAGKDTVVPGRNLLFAAVAVAHAVRVGAGVVYLAPHAGDAEVYPDCRRAFLGNLSFATEAGYCVRVEAPGLGMTKAGFVGLGRQLKVPFDMTWSCYDPQDYDPLAPASGRPCGVCGACRSRKEALA